MSANNSSMQEDLTIPAETKLYYDLYVPDEGDTPRPLLIALHGYGANKRQMMREARQLAPHGFAIASPQGFHQHMRDPREPGGPPRYGFGWLTNFHPEESVVIHHSALLDLIDNLTGRKVADAGNIFLLGFSQSCALNYRFAFTHVNRLRGVVGICGGIPGDWETGERYQKTEAAVFHLSGKRDDFYTPERVKDYGARLSERAARVEVKSYDAAHEIVPEMRDDVRAWLQSQID
ncbi:MAG TPA: dienelactone hydrolase family protein [Pyrinomonadaceae bacterium]|jgi:phospholipase/carboxylesterase|nr:dienelactone hydrolase family protein [Pyrinomonadaceae bacterium]